MIHGHKSDSQLTDSQSSLSCYPTYGDHNTGRSAFIQAESGYLARRARERDALPRETARDTG
jgi:hypothetical protein